MATVLRRNGFNFRIYPNDHLPAHVHVIKDDGEAIIKLGDEKTPPSIRQIYGMQDRDVATAYKLVKQYRTKFLNSWREIHEGGNK
jgi:hypothetical protein